jgi:murein L,D-transpeptidase YafK
MKRVLIVAILLVLAIMLDIFVEFKEQILPKEVKIIKQTKKTPREPIDIPKREYNISKVLTQDPKVIKLLKETNSSIDLGSVETVINKEGSQNICSDDISIDECISKMNLSIGDEVFIRIFKLTAELEVWLKADDYYQLLKIYPICKQSGFLGPKLQEGDAQAPEGFYHITKESLNPNSRYHLSFDLGFPNEYDRLHSYTGSALMIHGGCKSVGCYAMGDKPMEEIYELVDEALERGQESVEVHIFPFRMTDDIMLEYSNNEWYNFWGNLKEGYDYFEEGGVPPMISVVNRRYEFE